MHVYVDLPIKMGIVGMQLRDKSADSDPRLQPSLVRRATAGRPASRIEIKILLQITRRRLRAILSDMALATAGSFGIPKISKDRRNEQCGNASHTVKFYTVDDSPGDRFSIQGTRYGL
jgi:hypothetical protein